MSFGELAGGPAGEPAAGPAGGPAGGLPESHGSRETFVIIIAMKMVPNFAMIEIELRKTVLFENIKAFKKAVEEVQLETSKLL